MENIDICVEWEGPFSLEDIGYDENSNKYSISKELPLNDDKKDYGIYQVYGYHPVYGNNVLLYIGKADDQTFAKRLSQEGWAYNEDYKNIQIYVGRLFGREQKISGDEWSKQIGLAERMLIFAHAPAKNSSNILNITKDKTLLKEFENIRVFNYDAYRSLMPELSGELWVKGFNEYNGVYSTDNMIEKK